MNREILCYFMGHNYQELDREKKGGFLYLLRGCRRCPTVTASVTLDISSIPMAKKLTKWRKTMEIKHKLTFKE